MMATMKGSMLLSCSFLVLLMTQTTWGLLYNSSGDVTPPTGNSPKIVVKTTGGYFVYTCVKGAWVPGRGYATLVGKKTNQVIGNYTRKVDSQGYLGTWTLINSPGNRDESGHAWSIVTGRRVGSSLVGAGSLPNQLLEAASHIYPGEASLVSYIQLYNVVGGAPPPKDTCSTLTYKSVTVPFQAEFCLWVQDPVPASVPAALAVSGRFVENFFAKGHINYKFDGSAWVESGRAATLYSMPGTQALGQFTLTNGVECWKLNGSNALTLYGERVLPEVTVVPNACPWSLSKVISGSGLVNLGVFSYVQTCSTRGGVVPSSNFSLGRVNGATRAVPFSAIFNIYVR